jgi:hypothetical protein
MPLTNAYEIVVWSNYAASAGETSPAVSIFETNSLLVYVNVSGATTITLQVYVNNEWHDYDSITFSAAGENFWNIWSLATSDIRFKTSNAVTITLTVWKKA